MRKVMRIILTLMMVTMAVSQSAYADGGGHGRIGVYIGPGWWGQYPSYPYYYSPMRVIVEQPQEMYVQPAPAAAERPSYWYYCKDSQEYYPTVKKCPGGWMKVVPPLQSLEGEE